MSYFQNSAELQQCIGGLCEQARRDARVGPKIKAARIVVQFRYEEPTAILTIDAIQPTLEPGCYFAATWDEALAPKPEVTLQMHADVAHRFWHGKVNLLNALRHGEIVQQGPLPKILRLLPAIQPLYALYPEVLRAVGRADLIIP
jgi:hypothetical protein